MPKRLDTIWSELATHRAATKGRHLRELFAEDQERFNRFSARLDDLLLDYSKTSVTPEALALLLKLAAAAEGEGEA